MSDPKMSFHVDTVRLDAHGSLSRCKAAEIPLDTDLAGNQNAFNSMQWTDHTEVSDGTPFSSFSRTV